MSMNKEEYDNLLAEIAETGGPTDKMMELLQKLRDDFDMREGELRSRGEEEDKNEPGTEAEKEKIVGESIEDNKNDSGLRRDPLSLDMVPKADYDDLKRRYIERFFGKTEDQIEDEKESEDKKKNLDDLFD